MRRILRYFWFSVLLSTLYGVGMWVYGCFGFDDAGAMPLADLPLLILIVVPFMVPLVALYDLAMWFVFRKGHAFTDSADG